jgi:hypothetical protein
MHHGLCVKARYTVPVWVGFHFKITFHDKASSSAAITSFLTLYAFDFISFIN